MRLEEQSHQLRRSYQFGWRLPVRKSAALGDDFTLGDRRPDGAKGDANGGSTPSRALVDG